MMPLFKVLHLFYKNIVLLFRQYFDRENAVLILAQHPDIGGTRTYFNYLIHFFKEKNVEIDIIVHPSCITDELKRYTKAGLVRNIYFEDDEIGEIEKREFFGGLLTKGFILFLYSKYKCSLRWNDKYGIYKYKYLVCSVVHPVSYFSVFFLPVKLVFIYHGLLWTKLDTGNYFILKFCFSSNKKILAVSNYAKDLLLNFWRIENHKNKADYVYNYYHQHTIKSRSFKSADDPINILTIGSLMQHKNPLLWIEYAKYISTNFRTRQINFIWAGDGPMFEQVKSPVLSDYNIFFIGHQEDVSTLYLQADIYFQPSIRESQGIAIVGAMANSLPCVVNRCGGPEEYINDGNNGFIVDVENFENTLSVFSALIENQILRHEVGSKARVTYNQLFTKERWLEKMDKIF